ncbi:ThiF family adenylyltransferase [Staphylococcus kloosii]|uniref:ThiF family adenylyltransferase n=1 Tax=Staphylococcus kloosii TaxID=29384 RepID=UPI0028A35E7F|nr:ThiF family adenylyltransferase [Staphylococcus kloosii]MDT3960361.1 ThiF family adenylyltransferase [Staphylococcus kloosii]
MNRYNRQSRYQRFGEQGQQHLQTMHVMILGAGALGSNIAEMLTRMGVHEISIIDMDIVELSNIHRQALYDEADAQQMLPKVKALKSKLNKINTSVKINVLYEELTATNIEKILSDYNPDIVMDGMDHFEIRYLINEACYKLQIPWIYGAAVGSKGTVYAIDYKGPCFKCLLQAVPNTGESCAINGVLPPVINQVVSMQVSELMRYAAGEGFSKKLITIDTFDLKQQAINIDRLKNDQCHVCKQGKYELLNKPQYSQIEAMCGNAYLFRFKKQAFDYATFFPGRIIKENAFAKLMQYKDVNCTLFRDGRMNVHGIKDDSTARQLYEAFNKQLK